MHLMKLYVKLVFMALFLPLKLLSIFICQPLLRSCCRLAEAPKRDVLEH